MNFAIGTFNSRFIRSVSCLHILTRQSITKKTTAITFIIFIRKKCVRSFCTIRRFKNTKYRCRIPNTDAKNQFGIGKYRKPIPTSTPTCITRRTSVKPSHGGYRTEDNFAECSVSLQATGMYQQNWGLIGLTPFSCWLHDDLRNFLRARKLNRM
jgi:hypothetical protein